jgi:hypothetical protein
MILRKLNFAVEVSMDLGLVFFTDVMDFCFSFSKVVFTIIEANSLPKAGTVIISSLGILILIFFPRSGIS